METKELKKMIIDFLVELRQDSHFNSALWETMIELFRVEAKKWNDKGSVPMSMVPYMMDLASQLSGGNRFADPVTSTRMEDAEMELLDLFYGLYDEEDNEIVEE